MVPTATGATFPPSLPGAVQSRPCGLQMAFPLYSSLLTQPMSGRGSSNWVLGSALLPGSPFLGNFYSSGGGRHKERSRSVWIGMSGGGGGAPDPKTKQGKEVESDGVQF